MTIFGEIRCIICGLEVKERNCQTYRFSTKYMSVGTDTNHLQIDNGDIVTGCIGFRYLGTIFSKDGRDTKGNTSTENNRCIKWAMMVKEHNKKPEKHDL